MNISALTVLAVQNGWKPVRSLNRSFQYKNQQNDELLTVFVPDESDISDEVARLFSAKAG